MLVDLQLIRKFERSCEPGYWRSYVLNTVSNNGGFSVRIEDLTVEMKSVQNKKLYLNNGENSISTDSCCFHRNPDLPQERLQPTGLMLFSPDPASLQKRLQPTGCTLMKIF